ncbi:hypothetical protein MesoLj113a_38470 [Mesorhizobium sp. 113-1-2]|uniref:hypothetical protein n=1 Tax=Mesorhizobium sp. 113-1-2 TaxID=2744515 RepID=UPI001926C105|nr:hypothetical protein [Mesorhizobium sp. 113-1-2]BCG72689.1 hypothetical protein MesoLj113a_38470 [Mesorhizobium sp. 113-1-2]
MMPAIISVEAVLAEDDPRWVVIIGHCANVDDDVSQWVEMPIAIDPANLLAGEWVEAARPGEWQALYG